ncbi:16S rRNA (cytidine(1402)-2'-O)-methyltransferase [Lacticaseibacillus saniviri]
MQRQSSFKNSTGGALYLVPTPIGNLDDMTFRAIDVLNQADLIAAEDTRNTQKLLNHFEIETKQISFHEHNTQQRIPELIARMKQGEIIAQVSDAGMPSISDPGHELVNAAIAADIPVVPLPGANAATTALIASGLAPQPFMFYGFLPRKAGQQQQVLNELKNEMQTIIFYESPHRLGKTLAAMQAVLGDRQAVLARELTKKFEEFIRGSLSELTTYANEDARGEYVVLVAGKTPDALPDLSSDDDLKQAVADAVAAGNKPNDAIKMIARQHNIKKQTVYNAYHEIN